MDETQPATNPPTEPFSPGPTADPIADGPDRKSGAGFPAPAGLIALVLALIAFYVYWPARHFDFVNFDDPDYVTSNVHVQGGLTARNIAWAFSTGHSGNWHPLTWVSHLLDIQLFGLRPGAAHLVNLLLHATNTVLLFFLLRRLTGALWRSALVAALFALHPLHVESVAWIAERKDVLSTFFCFLTLLAYATYARARVDQPKNESREPATQPALASGVPPSVIDARPPGPGARFSYLLALLFFALGLMCKPMLVTLPFVMLLLDYWPLGRMRLPFTHGSRLVLEKIPFFGLTVASSIVTFLVQRHAGAMQSLSTYPVSIRIENSLVSYARYLGKTLWPVGLATPYSHPGHWPATNVLFAGLLLIGLCIAAIRLGRSFPFVATGWFWFFGMMVPVIGLVQVGAQSMADRYTYVPLVGLFIVLAWGLVELVHRERLPASVATVLSGSLLALCAVRTRDQLQFWKNTESLFVHALAVTKNNWIAHYNLGWHLQQQGHLDEALAHYRQTVEIKPAAADALNNMGIVFVEQKHFALAIPYFEAALNVKPEFLDARDNLGKCLAEIGKTNEAIAQFKQVLQAQPDHVAALNNLANALVRQGLFSEAVTLYEKSLRAKPEQVAAHYDMAHALFRLRRADEAIQHYRLALANDPNHAEAHHDLGIALAMQGKMEEALTQLREAVRCKPADPLMHRNLAKALVAAGHAQEAVAQYNEALRLNPDFVQARKELDAVLAQTPK